MKFPTNNEMVDRLKDTEANRQLPTACHYVAMEFGGREYSSPEIIEKLLRRVIDHALNKNEVLERATFFLSPEFVKALVGDEIAALAMDELRRDAAWKALCHALARDLLKTFIKAVQEGKVVIPK